LSRGSSRRSSSTTLPHAGSSSTTPPRAGSSSTTSPTPCVRVPGHVARLVTRPVTLLVIDYSASRRLVIDYFAYAVRLGASTRRVAHRSSSTTPRHAGSSHGSLRRSSSTTSPPPRVRVPRHVTWLVTWLVVDYSMRRDILLRPQWLYFSHAVCRDYLSCGNTGSTSSTSRAATTSSSGRIV
jgi:hypothetical protein